MSIGNPTASAIGIDCVYDTLPSGFTYEVDSGTVDGNDREPDLTCEPASGIIAWFFDGHDIEPGDTVIVAFTADVDEEHASGCFTNSATVLEEGDDFTSRSTGPTAVAEVVADDDEPTGCGTTTTTPVTPPAIIHTATPTSSATPEATDTAEPTTAPATEVPAPPTATPPGGGTGGVIVGPNAGTGGASTSSASALAAAIVALSLLAAGSIALATAGSALRRRR